MKKISILFVCHGNICRSPMAEFVMKDLVRERGVAENFHIESAATSTEEIGNSVYPPAKKILAEHGIRCVGKTARQMTLCDFETFDKIVLMDENNLYNLRWILPSEICKTEIVKDPILRREKKISLLMDYTDFPREVADPWYTGNFEATWNDVVEGCEGLLSSLL